MRLAYGSWPSPVSAASLQEGALQIDFPSADGGRVFWVEGRPGEGGRAALMMCPADGEPLEVSPPGANVRSRVHEYGGRPYAVRGDVAVFCDAVTQRLHRVTVGRAQAVGVTPDLDGAVLRWAGLEIDPSGSFVLAVQEDHRGSGGCLDALVRLDLGGDNRDGGSVLFSGADFVSAPRPSADWSRLAFVTWNHPNMPWHETTLWVGDLDERGNLTGVRSVANGCAWTDPGWLPDGRLLCSGDRSGWWNLYAFDVAGSSPEPVSLLPRDADYGRPEWLLGHTTRAVLSDGRVVAERIEGGSGRYEIIDLASGEGQPMDDDLRVDCTSRSGGVVAAGDDVVIYSGFVDRPPMLVRVDLRTGRRRVVRDSSGTRSMPRLVSVAEQVSWRSVDGSTAYGHLYPPRNSDLHGLRGERPPLIVTCHGGPTSMAYGTFSPSNAFWTSRGFALLDVNYAGSSGFGRAYRERLDGQWGVADVGDVITGVSALADRGLVDRRRVAIMGASAGGFLALAALTFSETFTAGVSWFGIGDLELLARGTHKFEAHYLDRLVGPYPETATLYRARSPIHHLDRLTCPMLLLQGLDDRVVPPNQAEDMAAAVRAKGLPVALIRFEGEGHGFRQDRTRIAAYQSTEYFPLGSSASPRPMTPRRSPSPISDLKDLSGSLDACSRPRRFRKRSVNTCPQTGAALRDMLSTFARLRNPGRGEPPTVHDHQAGLRHWTNHVDKSATQVCSALSGHGGTGANSVESFGRSAASPTARCPSMRTTKSNWVRWVALRTGGLRLSAHSTLTTTCRGTTPSRRWCR